MILFGCWILGAAFSSAAAEPPLRGPKVEDVQPGKRDSCEEVASRAREFIFLFNDAIVVTLQKDQPLLFLANQKVLPEGGMFDFVPCGQTLQNATEVLMLTVATDMVGKTNWQPEEAIRSLPSTMSISCPKGNIIIRPKGRFKVDSFEASSAITACANLLPEFGTDAGGTVGLYVAIKGKRDVITLWRIRRVPAFDPKRPPIDAASLPEIPLLKICDEGSSTKEVWAECMKRQVRR